MEKHRMCPNCRAFIGSDDRICPYCEARLAPRAAEAGSRGEGMLSQGRFTTTVILLINFGMYAATTLYSMRSADGASFMDIDGRTLLAFGAKFRQAIFAGEWWRLVTAGFLHGGLLHIGMNSWVLFGLGPQVEEFFGTSRFAVIYFLATVSGFIASTYWSGSLSVGASAGIFGLIGAMIAYGMKSNTTLGAAVRGHYTQWAMYGLLMGFFPGFRVDNAAHLGGLAAGFAVAYVAGTPRLTATLQEKAWSAAAVVCVLATVLSFAMMFLRFSGI
ncbi:MAG TPA: rhomboid family intramembrane serine protease [Bryobacteraceae bacterium]|nr:rhomboid family intramembrane serine protease [Bryobacteraceae bacterium]